METTTVNFTLPAMCHVVCTLLATGMTNVNVDVPVNIAPVPIQPQLHLEPPGLPKGYVAYPDIGFAYKIPDLSYKWQEFHEICTKDGGQFASIDSLTKLRYIWSQNPGTGRLNVGIYRMFDTGVWTAVSTGLPLSSLPWASGEPADVEKRHCAQIDYSKKGLVTTYCSHTWDGVCEIPLIWNNTTNVNVDVPVNVAPVLNQKELQPDPLGLPKGYVAHPDIGFAYKVIDDYHPWQELKEICAADGGRFALIDSLTKFRYIWAQKPGTDRPYVGIYRMFDTGDWIAVSTGLSLPSLPWASGEPMEGKKHCAQIGFDKKGLVTDYCHSHSYGVCEIPLVWNNTTNVNVDVSVNIAPVVNQKELQPEPPGLPKGYVAYPDIGFAYKITDRLYTWQDFQAVCAADGGQFASIDSLTKLRYIWAQKPGTDRLHVGIYRMFDTGDWITVSTGLSLPSLLWASGEPKEGEKHCAQIDFDKKGLVTVYCHFAWYGVCEIPLVRNNTTNVNVEVPVNIAPVVNQKELQPEPPGLPKGYVAYPDIGFAYKITDRSYTWQEEKEICTEDGGQFASIDSLTKLRYIWSQKPGTGNLNVGIFRMFDTGNWVAVSTGLPLSSLPWASGEPKYDGRKHCARINYSAKGLVTTYCDHTWNGVCEIPLLCNNMTNVNVNVPAVNQKQLHPEPPVLPKGYAAYPNIGFAYKITDRDYDWDELEEICAKDGGQFALIDSMTKLRYLWTQMPGTRNLNVGIFKNLDTGNWTAVSTGLPLSSLPWALGEPADEEKKRCVQINYSKKGLVTMYCTHTWDGVCEIPLVWNNTATVNGGD